MGSTSTRRKLAEDLNVKQDRISNLPSCLISHILSFLPTKNAVATSVLSTKWKYLWTLTTSLEFSDEFENPQADRSSLQTSFTKFMHRILQYDRFPCLTKFQLCSRREYGEYHVYAWVDFAVKHNVEELVLKLPERSSPMLLPRALFTCRTLVKLILRNTGHIMMAQTEVVLPCLKVLDLYYLTFPDDESITSFFSGCPLLEELSIGFCIGKCVKVVNISAPLLTSLEMTHLPEDSGRSIFNYKIVLNTPCLTNWSIRPDMIAPQGYELNVLPHLKQVYIFTMYNSFPVWYSETRCRILNDLLEEISRVEVLEFGGDESIEEIFGGNFHLPTFQNLTKLKYLFKDVSLMAEFLHSSPLLRTLSFGEGVNWDPPENVPECLLFHLKFIEIRMFNGKEEEFEVVEYLLRNARVLEKLVVQTGYRTATQKKLKISTKLLMLRRASPACQIEILPVCW